MGKHLCHVSHVLSPPLYLSDTITHHKSGCMEPTVWPKPALNSSAGITDTSHHTSLHTLPIISQFFLHFVVLESVLTQLALNYPSPPSVSWALGIYHVPGFLVSVTAPPFVCCTVLLRSQDNSSPAHVMIKPPSFPTDACLVWEIEWKFAHLANSS